MPKTKNKIQPKEVIEGEIDPEGILGEPVVVDENADDEDVSLLDEDEVDPFKDKWEE